MKSVPTALLRSFGVPVVPQARQSTTPTSLSELSFLTNARLHPSSTRPDPQLVAPARPPPLVRTAPLIGSTTSPSRSVMFTEFPSESGSLLQTENNGEEESEEKVNSRSHPPASLRSEANVAPSLPAAALCSRVCSPQAGGGRRRVGDRGEGSTISTRCLLWLKRRCFAFAASFTSRAPISEYWFCAFVSLSQ